MRAAEEILKDYARRLDGFDESLREGTVFHNPTCGDTLRVTLGDTGMRWAGEGCSLMLASASLLSRVYARALSAPDRSRGAIRAFVAYAIGRALGEAPAGDDAILSGIGRDTEEVQEALFLLAEFARYPVRRECILLPWNAVKQLLEEI